MKKHFLIILLSFFSITSFLPIFLSLPCQPTDFEESEEDNYYEDEQEKPLKVQNHYTRLAKVLIKTIGIHQTLLLLQYTFSSHSSLSLHPNQFPSVFTSEDQKTINYFHLGLYALSKIFMGGYLINYYEPKPVTADSFKVINHKKIAIEKKIALVDNHKIGNKITLINFKPEDLENTKIPLNHKIYEEIIADFTRNNGSLFLTSLIIALLHEYQDEIKQYYKAKKA